MKQHDIRSVTDKRLAELIDFALDGAADGDQDDKAIAPEAAPTPTSDTPPSPSVPEQPADLDHPAREE